MNQQSLQTPLLKLPRQTEMLILLIKEELKSNKFFNGLAKIGLEDCYYQPNLSNIILAQAGFEDCPDDLMNFYVELVEKHSEQIENDNDSITKEALDLYMELMMEKKRRDPSF